MPAKHVIRYSLRKRLFAATVLLVAVALGVSFVWFDRSARAFALDAARSHLAARAREVLEATNRFQSERQFTVGSWAEASALMESLDTGDPKFAEDFLRRAIQDQRGAFSSAALLDSRGRVVAAVRAAGWRERRGLVLEAQRTKVLDLAPVRDVLRGDSGAVAVADARQIDPGQPPERQLVLSVPVRDFTGEAAGVVVAAVPPDAFARLLGEIDGGEKRLLPVVADPGHQMVVSLPGEDVPPALVAGVPSTAPGTLEEHDDGEQRIFAVRTAELPDTPRWYAAVSAPQREALAPLSRLRILLAAMFVLVLGFSAGASVLALKRAAQPLAAVASSMTKVAAGDLGTRVSEVYGEELGHLVASFNVMVSEVASSRDALATAEALRKEMQLAHEIQTAILPRDPTLPDYEVAARLKPAADVGGDLYDILPCGDDTFWILIGDVSGHGIHSGLIMMMAQAAAHGAIRGDPRRHPREVIGAINRVLFENVRKRMHRDDYLTVMAARHLGDGKFVASGSHQPAFIVRSGGGVETIDPAGPWCGIVDDIAPRLVDYQFSLEQGDLLCLITDGITEAKDQSRDLFGDVRLTSLLSATRAPSAAEVVSDIFSSVERFAASQEDDMTAVVLKRKGAHA